MECMIEMLKQRNSGKICEEGQLDELTDDVYNTCFREQIYDENKISRNSFNFYIPQNFLSM